MTDHFTQEEVRASLEQALDALESLVFNTPYDGKYGDALTAGREALETRGDWLEKFGFELREESGVWLCVDDSGEAREATLNERVLWDAATHPQASEPAPSTAVEPTHQGEIHEQQVRPEVGTVGGQQPVESSGNSGHIDRANLVASILALLALDSDGALVPHGVGGHARKLLTSAAALLQSTAMPSKDGAA